MKKSKGASKGKGVFRTAILVLCGLVVGLNIYTANANNLVGEQLPMPFGYGAAVVLSGSMEPELSTGDLIIVKETADVKLKDIVVFQDGRSLVVHRIVSISEDDVVTKGDANNVDDQPIELADVKGKVVFSVPAIGTLVNLFKTPIGVLLTIIIAVALIEIPRRREMAKDEEEREKIIEEIKRLKEEQF